MPSLSAAYERRRGPERAPRRVAVGVGLFAAGAAGLVAAILVVTTPLSGLLGLSDHLAERRVAGALAGLGVPALMLGVIAVLPSSRREQVGGVLGTAVAVGGVGLFWRVYPERWVGAADPLVFETTVVYFLGGGLALWFLFTAVATFKRRNDPHGTVTLEVKQQGEVRTVEVTRDELARYRSLVGDGGTAAEVISEIEDGEQ